MLNYCGFSMYRLIYLPKNLINNAADKSADTMPLHGRIDNFINRASEVIPRISQFGKE
jgi:hypothetical protein